MAYIIQNRIKYGGSVPQVAVQDTAPDNPNIELWFDTSEDAVAEAKDIKYDNSVSGSNKVTVQAELDKLDKAGKVLFQGTLTTGSSTTIAELADYSLFVVYSYGSTTGVTKPVICVKQTSTLTIDGVGGFYINTSIAGTLTMSFSYSGTTLTFSGGLYITHHSGSNHPDGENLTISKIIGLV